MRQIRLFGARQSLQEVLIERDGLTQEQADQAVQAARKQLNQLVEEGDIYSAYEICADKFGLEPDYLEDLML